MAQGAVDHVVGGGIRRRRRWSAGQIISLTVFLMLIGRLIGPPLISTIDDNWRFSIDGQGFYGSCLPWQNYFILVGHPRTIRQGELIVFNPPPEALKGVDLDQGIGVVDGFIKIVAGVPGDRVTIARDGVWIDGRFWGRRFLTGYLDLVHLAPVRKRSFVIPAGHYFVMGTSADSYDSRYWGMITSSEITGLARPL